MKLIDQKPRGVLAEGRSYGIGFALAKRKGGELHLTGPISPCREYLNDQLSSEHTGKPYQCYGYKAKKEGLLEDDRVYLVFGVMPNFGGSTYWGQEEETKRLVEDVDKYAALVNQVEELLKIDGRTTVEKLDDNRYVSISPPFWMGATYLISLLSMLYRVALESPYKGEDAIKFLTTAQGTDKYNLPGVLVKLDKMIKGTRPRQDFSHAQRWHEIGIVNYNF